jgi:hypothetical protein
LKRLAKSPAGRRPNSKFANMALALAMAMSAWPMTFSSCRADDPAAQADTALILAVDVSNSVDEVRYQLQMEGIARALEDKSVIDAITGGPHGGIFLSLVSWADHAPMTLPWQSIRSAEDARRVAGLIRAIPHQGGEFTCLARMLNITREKYLDAIPGVAAHTVVDVSGDGVDNCDDPDTTLAARDAVLARGVNINGLPIIVKGENEIVNAGAYRAPGYGLRELPEGAAAEPTTLDAWYRNFVIGGPSAFLHVSNGFDDFGRAFRQKFVTEISAVR